MISIEDEEIEVTRLERVKRREWSVDVRLAHFLTIPNLRVRYCVKSGEMLLKDEARGFSPLMETPLGQRIGYTIIEARCSQAETQRDAQQQEWGEFVLYALRRQLPIHLRTPCKIGRWDRFKSIPLPPTGKAW